MEEFYIKFQLKVVTFITENSMEWQKYHINVVKML